MGKEAETRGDEKRRDGTRKEKRWERHLVNWIRTTLLFEHLLRRDKMGQEGAKWDETLHCLIKNNFPSFQEAMKWVGTVKGEVIITLDFFTLGGEEQKRLDRTRWDETRKMTLPDDEEEWLRTDETKWDETLSIFQEETRKDKKELTETRREMRNLHWLIKKNYCVHIWQEVVLFRGLKKIVLENDCFFHLLFSLVTRPPGSRSLHAQ